MTTPVSHDTRAEHRHEWRAWRIADGGYFERRCSRCPATQSWRLMAPRRIDRLRCALGLHTWHPVGAVYVSHGHAQERWIVRCVWCRRGRRAR